MNEMEIDNNETVVKIEMPSAKEQVGSALIGLGVTLGAYAVMYGAVVGYNAVRSKIADRRARKIIEKLEEDNSENEN